MVATPPAQVYNAVHPVAAQYGVPDPIWETVAYMESSYNPSATGDAGTSFGLFQLHEGGQLRTSPSSVMGQQGMSQNALEAMPAIADAWQNLKPSFNPSSLDWWTQFAAQSGHPGGGPGNTATDNAAYAMLNDYSSNTGLAQYNQGSITQPIPNANTQPQYVTNTNQQCPAWCALVPFQAWGPCASCDPITNQQTDKLNAMIADMVDPNWWARIGVFILGGGLLLIGLWKLLK